MSVPSTTGKSFQSQPGVIFPPITVCTCSDNCAEFALTEEGSDAKDLALLNSHEMLEHYLSGMNSAVEYSKREDLESLESMVKSFKRHKDRVKEMPNMFWSTKFGRATEKHLKDTSRAAEVYAAYVQGARLSKEQRESPSAQRRILEIQTEFQQLQKENERLGGPPLYLDDSVKSGLAEVRLTMPREEPWTLEMCQTFCHLFKSGKRGQKSKDDIEGAEGDAQSVGGDWENIDSDDEYDHVERPTQNHPSSLHDLSNE